MYWPGSAGWWYEDSNDMRYWEVTDNPWTSEKIRILVTVAHMNY